VKLTNEIFTYIFCSSKRPRICLKNTNICCMFCDLNSECIEKNKNIQGIKPCSSEVETTEEIPTSDCPYQI